MTHGPEYRLHKYWSRKSAAAVSRLLRAGLRGAGVVVDPFCGSGVVLREAALLGCDAVGFDVNPVAALVSRVTLHPPEPGAFAAAADRALRVIEPEVRRLWGERRYVVHATVVRCDGCGSEASAVTAAGESRRRRCPGCGARIVLNLERMVRTEVVHAEGPSGPVEDPMAAEAPDPEFDQPFTPNRRVLAFTGMRTSHLFTRRNFALLTAFGRAVHALADGPVRDALLLVLTASAAQASRLIAWRNGLTTGGTAWSVPGFWVPPIHVESNPLKHLRARVLTIRRGIEALRHTAPPGAAAVSLSTAREGLAGLASRSADLVFLDPPYGDSVPYLEFSALWNSFLGPLPPVDLDLSVSDREPLAAAWARYEAGLCGVFGEVARVLRPDATACVTFNSHDTRAWQALLGAAQAHGLACRSAEYVSPAVVSAKAQLAPAGSYTGDIHALFSAASAPPSRDMDPFVPLVRTRRSHAPGSAAHSAALRALHLEWLRRNLAATLLPVHGDASA